MLTKEQIKNWRSYLLIAIGPYALLMTEEQIEKYKDKVQKDINSISVNTAEKEDN